ncbi:Cupredoxin [Desarmillaria ectypa]|nr:Cupredoxin [Desarmillaria ectypa]
MFSLLASVVLLALLCPHPTAGVAVPAPSKGGGKGGSSLKEFNIDLGFRGPLTIYGPSPLIIPQIYSLGRYSDPKDPLTHLYNVDDESTHNSTLPMLQQCEATGIIPVSDSGTVNGIGRFNGGPELDWSVINVVPGKRYRFRIINESARNVFTFSIDKQRLTVVEADGEGLTPSIVDSIEMLAGQRYSVVVHANQRGGNYWINAPFAGGNPLNNLNQNATLSRAILRYAGAPRQNPTTPMTVGPANRVPLIEGNLRPLVPEPAPPADLFGTSTNVSYLPPVVSALLKVIDGEVEASDFSETENTFLPANKTIPANDDDDAHREFFHSAHSATLILTSIRSDSFAWRTFLMNFESNTTDKINTKDLIKRDIVAAGAAGAMIRFRTDKPGMSSSPVFFLLY